MSKKRIHTEISNDFSILNTNPSSLTLEELWQWDKKNAELIIELATYRLRNIEEVIERKLDEKGVTTYPKSHKNQLLQQITRVQNDTKYAQIMQNIASDANPPPMHESIDTIHDYKLLKELLNIANETILPVFDFIDEECSQINDDILDDTQSTSLYHKKKSIRNGILDRSDIDLQYLKLIYQQNIYYNKTDALNFVTNDNESNKFMLRKDILDYILSYEIKIREKETIDPSEIPYYFVIVIGAERAFHTSLLLLVNGKLYSIGLGYQGNHPEYDKINNKSTKYGVSEIFHFGGVAACYSADFLIELLLKNRIVDFGIFTTIDAIKLDEFIKKATGLYSTCEYDEPFKFIVPTSSLLFPKDFLQYSTICTSNESANNINCTSFIARIFPHIHCEMTLAFGIVAPSSCKTYPPFDPNKFRQFAELYQDKSMDVSNRIITLLTPVGERYRYLSSAIQKYQSKIGELELEFKTKNHHSYSHEDLEAGIPDSQRTEDYSQIIYDDSQSGGKKYRTILKSTFRKRGAKHRKSTLKKSRKRKRGAKHKSTLKKSRKRNIGAKHNKTKK